MIQLHTRLGNGRTSTVELDNFTRILNQQFYDDEEIRCDVPKVFVNNFEYVGVALAGSSPFDSVWQVIRKSYDANGRGSRYQFQENIAWTARDQGWPQ